MSLPTPDLLQKLSRARLNTYRAGPQMGTGERRSRAKGVGLEFADHREYQPGDDIRHLDRHIHARLGQHVVKEFSLYQQLPVTILLDASASMAYGHPRKFDLARTLTAALAYVGLTGGDQVRVGVFSDKGIQWYSRLHGARRAAGLFSWLERVTPRGSADLLKVMRAAVPRLHRDGLLVVISDWLLDGIDEALLSMSAHEQEVVGVQVLAPEEVEPERLGSGDVRFIDAESGREVEASLDAAVCERYRIEVERWQAELKQLLLAQQGRYLFARSDADPSRLLLHDWRYEGLIG